MGGEEEEGEEKAPVHWRVAVGWAVEKQGMGMTVPCWRGSGSRKGRKEGKPYRGSHGLLGFSSLIEFLS